MKAEEDNDTEPVDIPPLTPAQQAEFYKNLSECRNQDGKLVKPAVLSIIPDFAQNYVPSRVNLDIPSPLTSLYDKTYREMSLAQIQEKAESVYKEISVTSKQVRGCNEHNDMYM